MRFDVEETGRIRREELAKSPKDRRWNNKILLNLLVLSSISDTKMASDIVSLNIEENISEVKLTINGIEVNLEKALSMIVDVLNSNSNRKIDYNKLFEIEVSSDDFENVINRLNKPVLTKEFLEECKEIGERYKKK